MKVIIVGGVAGGASCAARLRRLDEKAGIVMVERAGGTPVGVTPWPFTRVGQLLGRESGRSQTPRITREQGLVQ